jgi:hypothetical protein
VSVAKSSKCEEYPSSLNQYIVRCAKVLRRHDVSEMLVLDDVDFLQVEAHCRRPLSTPLISAIHTFQHLRIPRRVSPIPLAAALADVVGRTDRQGFTSHALVVV